MEDTDYPGWEHVNDDAGDPPAEPRGTGLRTFAVVCGALLVLVGLLGAATVRISQGARVGAAALEHQAQPLFTPSGPTPTAPTTGVFPLALGGTYVDRDGAGRSTVTVTGVKRVAHCSGYDLQPGYEFLVIYVQVRGAAGHTFVSGLFFNFTTNQGQDVVQNMPNCDAAAGAGRLPANNALLKGQTAKGYLAFEVPQGYGGILTFTKVAEELASWTIPTA